MPFGTYKKSAERANPACVIFLLDQSYSMNEGIAGSTRPKIDMLATAINRFIADLITFCEKDAAEEKPRHYFDVGVIGYTTDRSDPPNAIIGPVLQGANGTLAGRDLVSVVDLFDDVLAVEDRKAADVDDLGNRIETVKKFQVWYRKPPEDQMGGTPTCAAFAYVRDVAAQWAEAHPRSYPPMVIHLTDGEPNDGDPSDVAAALQTVATEDGELLLFNCHISSSDADPVAFPTSEGMLMDARAKDLFRISSELPEAVRARAEIMHITCPSGARGMVFNADAAKMIELIQLGTVGAAPPTNPLHF
ncbi:MAG: vWA domain-containing protein [Isosphaeraceae bacterium]